MRLLSRRSIRLTLLTLLLCLTLQPDARAEVADRIVAVVNDDIITLSELNEEGAPYFQALIKKVPTEQQQAEMQKLRQEILSHLIDQRLIDQQAAKLEIQVSEADIDQTIETILTDNHVSREQYKKDLADKGLTEPQYREQLKRQMLQSRLISHEVRSKVVVTEEKINQYFQENYTAGPDSPDSPGYHLLQMGFLFGDAYKSKTADEAKQAAAEAKKQLDGGKDFAELAKEVSDLPSKEDGGDIGVFQQSELAPSMKDVVLALKTGEVSEIIETPTGYQLVKLVSAPEAKGEAKAKVTPPPEIKKEIEAKLYQAEGEKLLKKWLSEVRSQAFIKENL